MTSLTLDVTDTIVLAKTLIRAAPDNCVSASAHGLSAPTGRTRWRGIVAAMSGSGGLRKW